MVVAYTLGLAYFAVFNLYHVVTGIVSVFFPEFSIRFYKALYHFEPIEREQYFLMLKPWGALSIHAGVLGFFVLSNLERYYLLLIPYFLLITIRVAYRIIFRKEIAALFEVDLRRNITNIGMLVLDLIVFAMLFCVHHFAPQWVHLNSN